MAAGSLCSTDGARLKLELAREFRFRRGVVLLQYAVRRRSM